MDPEPQQDDRPPIRRSPRGMLPLAGIHFLVFGCCFFYTILHGLRRFDSGESPAVTERVTDVLMRVLGFPVLYLPYSLQPGGPAGWILFVLNSLLWGWSLAHVLRRFRRAEENQPQA